MASLPSLAPLPTLLVNLTDSDHRIRKQAVREIARCYPTQAVLPLLPLLKDPRYELRALVARTLGGLRDTRALDPLCEALADKHLKVRLNVIQAVEQLADPRAVQPLIDLLSDDNFQIRCYAVNALGNLGDRRAVPALIAFLATADDELSTIINALGRLADPRAIPPLLALLEHPQIFRVIGHLGAALAQLRDRLFCSELQAYLSDQAKGSRTRGHAAWLLGYLTCRPSLPILINALTDKDAYVRYQAVEALASLRNLCAIEPLIPLLDDENEDVRIVAKRTLKILRTPGFF